MYVLDKININKRASSIYIFIFQKYFEIFAKKISLMIY
jgi:hypothetical protein